jgi:hypothetical protein
MQGGVLTSSPELLWASQVACALPQSTSSPNNNFFCGAYESYCSTAEGQSQRSMKQSSIY